LVKSFGTITAEVLTISGGKSPKFLGAIGEGINLYNSGREHGAVLVQVMPTARAISDWTRLRTSAQALKKIKILVRFQASSGWARP